MKNRFSKSMAIARFAAGVGAAVAAAVAAAGVVVNPNETNLGKPMSMRQYTRLAGFHYCQTNIEVPVFIMLKVNPADGTAIWAFPAMDKEDDVQGYGVGSIERGRYVGRTMDGLPFAFTLPKVGKKAAGDMPTLIGSIQMHRRGALIDLAVNCTPLV